MKRIVAICFGFLFPILLLSQNSGLPAKLPSNELINAPVAQNDDFDCPDHSYYSHGPLQINARASGSFFGSLGFRTYDMFHGAGPSTIKQVVFWGFDDNNFYELRDFTISVYQDNAGSPGALMSSSPAKSLANKTGFNIPAGYLMKYTAILQNPININPGDWLSVYAVDGLAFYWNWASGGDDGHAGYNADFDTWYLNDHPYDCSYCLVDSDMVDVPLSGWAIGLGVFLIFMVTLIGIRRLP